MKLVVTNLFQIHERKTNDVKNNQIIKLNINIIKY